MQSDVDPKSAALEAAPVEELVESLASLHEMERTTLRLISCGRSAVPALRGFLFRPDASGIYEPRCWAVRALSRIGAQEVLIEFLNADHFCTDPVAQFGEDAVINTAARALVGVTSEQAYQALLRLARSRALAGAIEVLGGYRRPEVVPILIRALEDDVTRVSAEQALINFGESVGPYLLDAAIRKEPTPEHESPSSALRRRTAIRLIVDTRTAATFWQKLRHLLCDEDIWVRARACRIGLDCGNEDEKIIAARALTEMLSINDSAIRSEIQNTLLHHLAASRDVATDVIERQGDDEMHTRLALLMSRVKRRRP